MTQQQLDIKRKLAALRYAEVCGNVALTARRFGISRQCFYIWKRAYEKHGEASLINKSPCPVNLTRATVVVVSSSRTARRLRARRLSDLRKRRRSSTVVSGGRAE